MQVQPQLPRRYKGKGPLLAYLEEIARLPGNHTAAEIVRAVRSVASTPEGRMLFAFIEEATSVTPEPGAGGRALREAASQRFISLDLQRIASNESDRLLEQGDARSGNRGQPRRSPSRDL